MTIVFQIVLAIVVIAFLVIAGMSSRTWRALHVTAIYLVFFAGFAFTILAASSLKTRAQWKEKADRLSEDLDVAKAHLREIVHGNPDTDQQAVVTLQEVRARLARLSLDRGRVWRQCQPVPGSLSGTPETPNVIFGTTPPGAEATPNRINVGAIIHLFREVLKDETPIPVAYVGEFRVTAATDDQATVEAVRPLLNHQVNQIRYPNSSWALYEIMPLDSHQAFVNADERIQIENDNVSIFGTVDEAEIREIFTLVNEENFLTSRTHPATPLSEQELDALILDRVNDGKREKDATDKNNFMKVRFTKSHVIKVDSTLAAKTNLMDVARDLFDAAGDANLARLRRGEPVEFKTDQIGIFHNEAAQPLIDDGTAVLMERIYVRELTDYDRLFAEVRWQIERLGIIATEVKFASISIEKADAGVSKQFAIRQAERVKLEDDQANVGKELETLGQYSDNLTSVQADIRQKLSKLYRTSNNLASQLADAHQRIRNNIDREIKESVDATP